MDTISSEKNSMLPIAALIVGVIGLILGGYAAIKVAGMSRVAADHESTMARIDAIESQVSTSSAASDRNANDLKTLRTSTQEAFNQVGAELGKLHTAIEAFAKAPRAPVAKQQSSAPVVAGPDEYIVKSGDNGIRIARENGISWSALQAVNPDVQWNRLAVGQKLKLPKK